MKRMISLLLAFSLMLSLCACQGNFGKVNLQEAIAIPADGLIKQSTMEQIKDENAVGSFYGESNGFQYEWTIFGSDIAVPKEINLSVSIAKTPEDDITVALSQAEDFGFSGLLSVHLEELWDAQSASAYSGETAVASVSLTGSKGTILNLSTDGTLGEVVIRPDAVAEKETVSEVPETEVSEPEVSEKAETAEGSDDYLSAVEDSGNQVYDERPETGAVPEAPKAPEAAGGNDGYLSAVTGGDDQVYTDGKDKYLTDPIPEGKPKPVEPEDQDVDKGTAYTCTFSIECSTILNNLEQLDPDKLEMVPSNGVILAKTTITFYEGESVFDALQRVCQKKDIHMESSWTPIYNSAYIEGIHNLYEFDCGNLSGWMYRVNGWYPNYGCSRYQLQDGDVVEWRYTCDLGNDIGGGQLFR